LRGQISDSYLLDLAFDIRQAALIRFKKQKDAITLANVDYNVDTRIREINKWIIYADPIKIPFLCRIRDTTSIEMTQKRGTNRLKNARAFFTGSFLPLRVRANGARAC
jgi:hypothetical protein